MVDERLGAEERELVAARVLAARDQHARPLEVRDLAEHLRLVELARGEADRDDAQRHLDGRLRGGRVVRVEDAAGVGGRRRGADGQRRLARVRAAGWTSQARVLTL